MPATLGLPVSHTDDLIGKSSWDDAKGLIVEWMNEPGPWCIEGVQMGRALRQWMRDNPTGKPCDKVIWLVSRAPLSGGRLRMAKGCDTIWNGMAHQLRDRGVVIERPNGHTRAHTRAAER